MTITPDSTYVISNSGDKVDLSNGMSVTARVEYDKLTYFEYAMEALGRSCSAKRSHQRPKRYERMKLNLKMLAVSAALLGLLAAGAALPASAAGPLNAAAALSLPWSAAAVESVETGTYASTMTVGTQQQLSPVILPAKAAHKPR